MADFSNQLYGDDPKKRDFGAEIYGDVPQKEVYDDPIPSIPFGDLAAGGLRGAGSIGATILAPWDIAKDAMAGKGLSLDSNNERRQQMDEGLRLMGADPDSNAYGIGKFGAEVAGTWGAGGVLANLLRKGGSLAPAAIPYLDKLAKATETFGQTAGPAGTTVAEMAANAGYRTAGGALSGGAMSGMVDPEHAAMGAGVGAVIPFAGEAIGQGVKFGGWLRDLAKGTLGEVQAAKIARDVAGKDIATIQAANASAPRNVTAAQAAYGINNEPYQAMGRYAEKHDPTSFYGPLQDLQERARLAAMKGITPDLQTAIKARESASKPFYDAAENTTIKLDAPFMDLFKRMPQGTLENAANIARMEGRPFIIGEHVPAHSVPTGMLDASGNPIMKQVAETFPEITGESLHYIKRALSDISNMADPLKGIGRDAQMAARSVLDDFLPAFENKIPAYGAGRRTFARESAPVNQSQVLTAMTDKLNSGSGERVTPFLNAIGSGQQAMLKKSTGFPRYEAGDLDKLLSPAQRAVKDRVAGEMQRDAAMSKQAIRGNDAFEAIRTKDEGLVKLPGFLSWVASTANKFLSGIESRVNQQTKEAIVEGMKSGMNANALLSIAPAHERNAVAMALSKSGYNTGLGAMSASGARQQ